MNCQNYPKNVTSRKFSTRVPSASLSSSKGSTKSKSQASSSDSSLFSVFSLDYHYYQSSAWVTALVGVCTVIFVLLSQNLKFFTDWQVITTIQTYDRESSVDSDLKFTEWRPANLEVLQKYGSDKCTVERVSVLDLSPERFEEEFRFKKLVLVTFPNGAEDWTEPQKWSKFELSRVYKKWIVHSGQSLEIVRKGGNADHASSLEDFIDNLMSSQKNGTHEPMHYVFDRKFYSQSQLQRTLNLPKYFQINLSEDESIFFLGSSMTGVVFHKHSDTWNGVVHGRKRWFLYPNTRTPPGGIHHGFNLLEWVEKVYPNLTEADKPIECIQQPGEIIYLPEGTYHATLNLGDTIAVGIQKRDPSTDAEVLFYEATRLEKIIQEIQKPDAKNPYMVRLLDIYKKLRELLPENSEVVMKTGAVLYDMGEYLQSLPWHRRAIKMDPYFVVAYLHLAKTFSALREYEKAEITFKKAIEISPNLWDNYKEYGEFLLKQGRHKNALPVYKKGTELIPDMIPFWFYYRLCQLQTGDQEGAEMSQKTIMDLKAKQEILQGS